MKGLAVLLIILFALSGSDFIPQFAHAQVVTTSTMVSQPLTPFVGTVQSKTVALALGQFGQEQPHDTFSFSSAKFSFANTQNGDNVSISFASSTLNGSPFVTQGLKNTSLVEIKVSSMDIQFKNASQPSVREIIFTGSTGSLSTVPMVLQFVNPSNLPISTVCDGVANTICTTICFNQLCFNWETMPCSFDSGTLKLTCSMPPSFTFDPLALDHSGTCTFNAASGFTSCAAALTTTNANDVLYCMTGGEDTTGFNNPLPTITGITDNKGNTWNNRIRNQYRTGLPTDMEGWYTTWSGSGAISITVTSSVASGFSVLRVVCFGISGANIASVSTIFDGNPTIPGQTNSDGTGVTSQTITISTYNANDFISTELLGFGGMGGLGSSLNACVTIPTSFTYLTGANIDEGVAYRIVSATQASVAETWSWTTSAPCTTVDSGMILDAVCRSGDPCGNLQPIKITNAYRTGAPDPTITISGCSPQPNTTFTANNNVKNYELTGSCTVTLTEPAAGTSTRHEFNVSPHDTASLTVTFATCASGTCGQYNNNSYYMLLNNYTATPQTPTTWDAAYTWTISGTYLGTAGDTQGCTITTSGGGVVRCSNGKGNWWDYNTAVSFPTIGNTWKAQAPSSFTDTTGANSHNVNYVQITSSSGADPPNYVWLLVIPILLIALVALKKRR